MRARAYLAVAATLVLALGVIYAGPLYQKHSDSDSVDQEFNEIYRTQYIVVNANRAPSDKDFGRVGTFWIDASSTVVYVRFPDPDNWRKIVTSAP